MKKRIFFSSYLLLCAMVNYGQKTPNDTTAQWRDPAEDIRAVGKYFGDSLVVRFAPLRPGVWVEGNKHGYVIERQEVDTTYAKPYIRLTPIPLKPLPLAQWQPLVGNPANPDRYAAIAAQSLYGKPTTAPTSMFDQADLLLNNFSNALLAAELSPKVAVAEGLRFTDVKIQPNKLYRYRIFIAGQSPNEKLDTAYVVIGTFVKPPLPQTALLPVQEGQNSLELRWQRQAHEAHFSAYYIERSDDGGKTYKRLTNVPYIQMDSHEKAEKEYFYYRDSVATNYKHYYYRLIGLTTYGEISAPSVAVMGIGRDRTPPKQPQQVKATVLKVNKIQIAWSTAQEPDLKGFIVGRSTRTDASYQPISSLLSPTSRSFIDENADPSKPNYYIVAAVDTANNGAVSLYAYGQIRDTIPPKVPTGLLGKIDTNGIVALKWKLGSDKDIKGYKVAFSNSPNRPFVLASNTLIRDTVWRDTINLRTLTKKIYYKIMAIDMMDNYSPFSEAIELTKPDKVPPVSPQFQNFYVSAAGIRLNWLTSSSQDVKKHLLQRRKRGENLWQDLQTLDFQRTSTEEYIDKSLTPNGVYQYQVLAIDDAGLKSFPSEMLTIASGDYRKAETLQNLKATYQPNGKVVVLSWQATKEKIVLYRADNGKHFSTLTVLNDGKNTHTDTGLRAGIYEYTAKVQYADGRASDFAPVVKIVVENK